MSFTFVGIGGALIEAGASLLGGGSNGGGGQLCKWNDHVINPDRCWEDGAGACPNGN